MPLKNKKAGIIAALTTSKLTIGYSLGALRFALVNNSMLLVNGDQRPSMVADGDALTEWLQTSFKLGMKGLLPLPSTIESIRIEDNTAKITTIFQRLIKIKFEELYLFDMELVEGLEVEERVSMYKVYDWFDIKRGAKQAACSILTPNSFVQKLVFYPSLRRDGNDGSFKDCYATSYVEAQKLGEFEHSETAAQFAVTKMIKEKGFRARPQTANGKIYYLNIALEHARRDLYKYEKDFVRGDSLPSNIFCCNERPKCS